MTDKAVSTNLQNLLVGIADGIEEANKRIQKGSFSRSSAGMTATEIENRSLPLNISIDEDGKVQASLLLEYEIAPKGRLERQSMTLGMPLNSENMAPMERALHVARHELATLHGLVVADGTAPQEPLVIDTREAVALIDEVLIEPDDTNTLPS